jgi:hypothetical protein
MKQMRSLLPDEIHPPFMNFMGPGTEVENRLSLNYKGKKGTNNYFIPTTYSDYVSFEHDLLYWSPDNVVKAYADSKFIKDTRSFIGLAGILLQYAKRLGVENFFNYQVLQKTLKNVNKMTNTINNLETIVNRNPLLRRFAEQKQRLDNIVSEFQRQRQQSQRVSGREREAEALRLDILNGIKKIQRREKFKSYFKLLPNLLITGYFLVPQIINSGNKLAENLFSLFLKNDEYEIIQKKVDDVKKKYEDYLDVVGEWKDAPWYRSLIAPIKSLPTSEYKGEQFFKIKDNIDTEKAKQKYIEFYDEWKKYAEFMNIYYEDKPGYQKFDIKELNKDMLELASNPTDQPSSYIEQWYKTNPLPSPSLPPPPTPTEIKNITEETETLSKSVSKSPPPIQISDSPVPSPSPSEIVEISKSLDKISETITPSITVVPSPSEKPPERIDYGIDFEDEIPEGMTVKEYIIQLGKQEKKEYDEEILKVLKGEQDVMFETPVEPMPSEKLVVTEQPEFMNYDFEAMNNMVEVEIQPTPSPYMYYGMDAI